MKVKASNSNRGEVIEVGHLHETLINLSQEMTVTPISTAAS